MLSLSLNLYQHPHTHTHAPDPGLRAAQSGDITTLRALVEKGWDPLSAEDRNGCNALHWAAGEGHLEVCKFLVNECSVDINELRGRMQRYGRATMFMSLQYSALKGYIIYIYKRINPHLS